MCYSSFYEERRVLACEKTFWAGLWRLLNHRHRHSNAVSEPQKQSFRGKVNLRDEAEIKYTGCCIVLFSTNLLDVAIFPSIHPFCKQNFENSKFSQSQGELVHHYSDSSGQTAGIQWNAAFIWIGWLLVTNKTVMEQQVSGWWLAGAGQQYSTEPELWGASTLQVRKLVIH